MILLSSMGLFRILAHLRTYISRKKSPHLIPLVITLVFSIFIHSVYISHTKWQIADPDARRFLHQATLISEKGRMPERDFMRSFPVGRPTGYELTLLPYIVAYAHRLLSLLGLKITLEKITVFQTTIFSTLAWIILYLAVVRLFDKNTALLATNLIVITPIMVQRNAPADRDALCLFLTVVSYYLYIRLYQSRHYDRKIVYASATGVALAVAGFCWQGVGAISIVIICAEIARLLFMRYDKTKFYPYLALSLFAITPLVLFKQIYRHLEEPYVFMAIGVPALLTLATAIYVHANKLYVWIPFAAGVFATMWLLVTHSVEHSLSLIDRLRQFQNQFLAPLEGSRLAETIGEFRKPGFWWWTNWPGLFFIPIFFGTGLLVFKLASSLKLNGWISAAVFQVLFALIIFSRVLSGIYEGKDTPLTIVIYLVSLLGLIIAIITSLYIHRSQRLLVTPDPNFNNGIFLLAYFVPMLLCARSAIRFDFLFAPVATITGSHAVVSLIERIANKHADRILVLIVSSMLVWEVFAFTNPEGIDYSSVTIKLWLGLSVACTILFSLLSMWEIYQSYSSSRIIRSITLLSIIAILFLLVGPVSFGNIKSYTVISRQNISKPSYIKPEMKQALNWIAENTPKQAVIASWWGWGSAINTLASRATVIDEEQIDYWIYLMARHVMVAQQEKEALEFLKTHGVTHLLLTSTDILLLPGISYLGSNESMDRKITLPIFGASVEKIEFGSADVVYRYKPDTPTIIKEGIQLKGRTRNTWEISSIYLRLKKNGYMLHVDRPWELEYVSVELDLGDQIARCRPQEIYFRDKSIRQEGENLLSGTILIYAESDDPFDWAILYLSQKARNSLACSLYLLNQSSNFFEPVYPPPSANYSQSRKNGSRQSCYVRIWKINYPKNVKLNPEYLKMDFEDPILRRAWLRGG